MTEMGISQAIIVYIDDWVIAMPSRKECAEAADHRDARSFMKDMGLDDGWET